MAVASSAHDGVQFTVDSGASHHMASDPRLFTNLQDCGPKTVRLGDSHEVTFSQQGTVDLLTRIPDVDAPVWMRLTNVLLVPSIGMNILSVNCLNSNGISVNFSRGKCRLTDDTDGDRLLAVGSCAADGLFWVKTSPRPAHMNVASTCLLYTSDAADD